jgi:hypothetical protein
VAETGMQAVRAPRGTRTKKFHAASRLMFPALIAAAVSLALAMDWGQVECRAATAAVVQELAAARRVIRREAPLMAFGTGHQVARLCNSVRALIDEASYPLSWTIEGITANDVCFRLGVVHAADGPLARREASDGAGPMRHLLRLRPHHSTALQWSPDARAPSAVYKARSFQLLLRQSTSLPLS